MRHFNLTWVSFLVAAASAYSGEAIQLEATLTKQEIGDTAIQFNLEPKMVISGKKILYHLPLESERTEKTASDLRPSIVLEITPTVFAKDILLSGVCKVTHFVDGQKRGKATIPTTHFATDDFIFSTKVFPDKEYLVRFYSKSEQYDFIQIVWTFRKITIP